jgi:ubiquitin C-terminal hydrolase
MNQKFRNEILSWTPKKNASESDIIIQQLQMLFANLHGSTVKYFDPTDFANAIKIKTSVQQDAQEFFKLFITLLEEHFALEKKASMKQLIQNEFQGKHQYVTTCSHCNTKSVTNGTFYELELSLEVNSSPQSNYVSSNTIP